MPRRIPTCAGRCRTSPGGGAGLDELHLLRLPAVPVREGQALGAPAGARIHSSREHRRLPTALHAACATVRLMYACGNTSFLAACPVRDAGLGHLVIRMWRDRAVGAHRHQVPLEPVDCRRNRPGRTMSSRASWLDPRVGGGVTGIRGVPRVRGRIETSVRPAPRGSQRGARRARRGGRRRRRWRGPGRRRAAVTSPERQPQ